MSLKDTATHYQNFGGKRRNVSGNVAGSVAGDEFIDDSNYYKVYNGSIWYGKRYTENFYDFWHD